MKKILLGLCIFVGVTFILWAIIIFPYPHCTTKQIEVMKQELIDGIIQREIKLRELYAEANEKEFIQTEAFKQQLQKEREKFYEYCANDGASEYKNEHCEIIGSTHWDIFGRIPHRTLKYHFDNESKTFFNQIVTFSGHKDDYMLYPQKLLGYSSDYSFQNSSDRPFSYLRGIKELVLENGEAVRRKDLVFIEAKSIHYKSISLDRGRHNTVSFGRIETYIQKEKK